VSTSALPRQGSLGAWVMATRPPTLAAAFVPVAVGTAVAALEGGVRWLPALAALAGALLLQIGANFANDVFDFEKGTDDEDRLGPTRAAQAGLLTPGQLKQGMVVAFVLATLAGVYLTWVAGWAIVAIGVASILSAVAYTGGPYPLGYHGLGDVFVMVFFGFVAVGGTAFVQLLTVPTSAMVAALPVGALATAILVVNNVRDRHGDARAGKRTLAVRWGKRGGLLEYALCLALAYGAPVTLAVMERAPTIAAPLLTLPIGVGLWRRLAREEGRPLNQVLAHTARLLVLHGATFTAGLALARSLRWGG
jgi:1,4-dihydroxy-2-naphthoate octaprenyltransferase